MHKHETRSLLIDSLRDGHTITAACKRAGVSRMFYDRHYKTDIGFRKAVDSALVEGRRASEDLVTTMYMKKIREGHWPAIHYAVKKKDALEATTEKKQEFTIRDIRNAIDALPKEAQTRHYDNLRDLLTDLSEFERTGRVGFEDNEGL